MVRRLEKLVLQANIAVFLVLCALLGIRAWKAHVWTKALPELEENRIWCNSDCITEKMVAEEFGAPDWKTEGITERDLLEKLGVEKGVAESDKQLKMKLYLLQTIGGLYGMLGFEFNQDGTVNDVTCSFSEDNKKAVYMLRKHK